MILITGASGTAGGAVLGAALARGLPVRAMYRSEAEAGRGPAAAERVVADFADAESLRKALDGVDAAFIVCGAVPSLVELEGNMIEACAAAGVGHVVLNSALGAGDYPKSFPSWHAQVEAKLKASSLRWTIVRPNGFMQNIAVYNGATIRADGAFFAALGDAKVSLIDVRDIGDVVASILGAPAPHVGKTYELNGPEALSNADIAERLSRAIGTPVAYVDIPEAAQREAMLGAGMPDWQVTAVLQLQDYYRSGRCAATSPIIAEITGKPQRTLDAYLAENVQLFRRSGS
ncbi:hypothetical protein RHAL1_01164 [Beijerinckiaceae bacterium RH AL1]|nr:NmrA family NAD(P)-binding protein [Beijerinckiaceae bacterium]VVB44272.1 hypothetical protein RHCH11_RHCH11_01139 [Beijerinckiaceae bacterium RH CH11]VVB44350.1 hypothetical protein RHAL8_01136 [Beijerinckiaceae bacterium RH AL8]VVC54269.1 hypothetical protein RHAL1_01164 [Beijerinckiaceae bacterium RH AL1]